MQIRLQGLPSEVDTALAALRATPTLALISVSTPYPNRGESRQVRVYLRAALIATHATRPQQSDEEVPG